MKNENLDLTSKYRIYRSGKLLFASDDAALIEERYQVLVEEGIEDLILLVPACMETA